MKSFGVRLAAGIVTILFGAYAAAVAQKDKQNDPQAWTAQPPSLGEPAMPIAGINEETWISQPPEGDPVRELSDLAANAFAVADTPDSQMNNGSVALVQHQELVQPQEDLSPAGSGAFDVAALPANLGPPETDLASDSQPSNLAMEVPDWTKDAPFDDAAASQPTSSDLAQPAPSGRPFAMPPGDLPEPTPVEPAATEPPAFAFAQPPGMQPPGMQPPGTDAPGMDTPSPGPTGLAALPETDAQDLGFATPRPAVGSEPSNGLRSQANPHPANFNRTAEPAPMGLLPQNANPQLAQNSSQFANPPALAPQAMAPQAMAPQALAVPSYPRAIPDTSPQNTPQPLPSRVASLPANNFHDSVPNNAYAPATSVDASQVFETPGDRRLEGMQSPSVVIQKRAPAEVKVGKPAAFAIHVQNVGSADALGVKVHDRIPAGMRLVDATPAPIQQGNLLLWELGAMRAGEERTVTMQLIPEAEGELGSVARVTFEAAASVRTRSTRPELKVIQNAPKQVLIGQQLEIELEVSNPGTGEATAVSLQEDVPDGLEHPRGRQLDNLIGNLAPGEIRRQVLRLRAVSPGMVTNTIRLVSEDGIMTEDSINVEVIAPNVLVDLIGPSKRFLERQATYQLHVANTGTADATNLEISVGLDRGFTFVSTDYEGSYDPTRHMVTWSLASLPAGIDAKVPLTLLPVQEGSRALTIDARADLGVVAHAERSVSVEGFAELTFQITNPGGPIEIGAESTYEITVTNEGSKIDSNIQVQAQLPQGIELISAEGNGNQAQSDGRGLVAFMSLNQLAPGDVARYRIRARGVAPGTHLIRAIVISDASPTPVTKEESTLVYADQ